MRSPRSWSVVVRGARLAVPAFAVACSFLMVSSLGTTTAAVSAPSPPAAANASPAPTAWAYGALAQGASSGSSPGGAGGPFNYQAKATFGFAVVVNETHPSSNVYVLNLSRVMGSILSVTFCRPNCATPVASATIYHRSWESANSSSTLLSNGTVLTGNGTVPALALASSNLSVSAGLVESTSWFLGSQLERAHNLSVHLNASDRLSLTPPLGLFPLNVSPGESWTSTSVFAQVGSYAWTFSDQVSGAAVHVPQNYTASGGNVFLPTGTISLSGQDTANPVTLGGSGYQAVALNLLGPFTLREGWILVPTTADLFGSVTQAWLVNQSGFANATQVNVDLGAHLLGSGHLSFGGSRELWYSRSANPATTALTSLVAPAVAGLATGPVSNTTPTTYVQGAPESPAQATAQQNCLSAGIGCPSGGPVPRGLVGLVLIAGAVAVVASLVAVLVVGQRRRIPPPVFPNAALYPPGNGPQTPPRTSPPSPPSAKPASSEEEDPLGHLW